MSLLPSRPLGIFSLFLLASCGGGTKQQASSPSAPHHVTTVPDEPKVPSSMDVAQLSYALRGSEDTFRKCFMRSTNSRGRVSAQFGVQLDGSVRGVRIVESDVTDSGVQQCLVDELTRQRFSSQATVSHNRYTFYFRLTDPLNKQQRKKLLKEADRHAEEAVKLLPESKGTIDLDHVSEIVQARYPLYAHCYRDSILRRGESRGVIRFKIHIDAEGLVSRLEDAGSVMPDPYAVDCMAEGFSLMQFKPPQGPDALVRFSMELQ